ncbi:Sir2 family histone deacetylase Hst4 [Blumeria hordei DH14]|uniref:Sir2 family histone deacetylase Hst4 n=1 Tax=Blumeria graminis f. sp. hordei (strain DH14) TaxID=546991 RepID=N1J642_BLUG1|nr:Sir2 family histone deacetylase Hst4 [Blumeria hordei DH14]
MTKGIKLLCHKNPRKSHTSTTCVNMMSNLNSPLTPASATPSSPLSTIASRSPTPPLACFTKKAQKCFNRARTSTKKLKVSGSRETNTEYLDIISLNQSNNEEHHREQDPKLNKLLEVLRTKRKIVVFAGAGISVSAGIPDFRSSKGLFKTLCTDHKLKASGKQLFDADVYRSNDATSSFHAMVRELSKQTKNANPTPFHNMLATLAEEGRLMRLYTQNVDGIDVRIQPLATNVPLNVKGPWPKAIQLHGGLGKMVCSKCGFLADFDATLFEGPVAPPCTECEEKEGVREAAGLRSHGVGRLRPRILLYNEHNPDEDAIGAVSFADITKGPDAVIVVGTSLQVPGIRRLAKEMCLRTRDRKNGFTAWINRDPEPSGCDVRDCWDMVVRADCDDIARIVGLPNWDDKDCGNYSIVENKAKLRPSKSCHVLVEPKAELQSRKGILTPTGTPRKPLDLRSVANPSDPPGSRPRKLELGNTTTSLKEKVPAKKPRRKPLPSQPTKKITSKFSASKFLTTSRQPSKKRKLNNVSHPDNPSCTSKPHAKQLQPT